MMEYTLFGESHGGVVGVVLEHVPAGIPVDEGFTAAQLLRRAPRGAAATARHETDEVAYLSGVFEGKTTGMPLVAVLRNGDVRPGDYEALRRLPRPGHADYAAFVRASGHQDYRGGGHYSGRLTAPLVVAGALALTYLKEKGIAVSAHVVDEENLRARAEEARKKGDSVGGQVACTVTGLPAGLGGPDYRDAVESEIARHVFAIPAVKALGFGSGEALASMEGSQANDPLRTDGERIYTTSNHAGGINGGVTNGMPVTHLPPHPLHRPAPGHRGPVHHDQRHRHRPWPPRQLRGPPSGKRRGVRRRPGPVCPAPGGGGGNRRFAPPYRHHRQPDHRPAGRAAASSGTHRAV